MRRSAERAYNKAARAPCCYKTPQVTAMSAAIRPRSDIDAERAIRVDLAAAYRLVALYGWDDIVFTHISARIPGPEHHFLINPYGMMFEEITASSLVKIDLGGSPIGAS